MPDLKPCPFCGASGDDLGGETRYEDGVYRKRIRCWTCGCCLHFSSGTFEFALAGSFEAWNRRAEPTLLIHWIERDQNHPRSACGVDTTPKEVLSDWEMDKVTCGDCLRMKHARRKFPDDGLPPDLFG